MEAAARRRGGGVEAAAAAPERGGAAAPPRAAPGSAGGECARAARGLGAGPGERGRSERRLPPPRGRSATPVPAVVSALPLSLAPNSFLKIIVSKRL